MNILLNEPLIKLPKELPVKESQKSIEYDNKILMGILLMMTVLTVLGLLFIDITKSFLQYS